MTYLAREMMYGDKEEFEYFACDHCGCLQIAVVPEDLGKYYKSDYYSFEEVVENGENLVFTNPVSSHERILDVGCGGGLNLIKLAIDGYGNLYGCDPFIEKDLRYGDRIQIRKCSIHEVERGEGFDRILMVDSFEHVTDPLEVMRKACELLKDNGVLEIHIPTFPNIAFELFGTHWYQLDAPRHITLHSVKSIGFLAQQSGLKVVRIEYDAKKWQIIRSFFYEHGA